MKLKFFAAAAVSAVITVCSIGSDTVSNAETTEKITYTVTFNTDYEGFTTKDISVFDSLELEVGDYVDIPKETVTAGDLKCSGWTINGYTMYTAGDFFKMPAEDIVLNPVWYNFDDEVYNVSYVYEGDGYEVMNPNAFKGSSHLPGDAVTLCTAQIMRDGYLHSGWEYEGHHLATNEKLIMPDHDVELQPHWSKMYKLYYEAGDVDRINGTSSFVYDRPENTLVDLPDASRISRSGFNLTGWLSDYDGKIYKNSSSTIMPPADVHFTAVWTPKNYTVVFKSNNDKNQTIKIAGETDSAITVPECTFTKSGYVFAGWKFEDKIYQPGEEFIIPGALPGLGISLEAVWNDPNSPDEEEMDSFYLVNARKQFANGQITTEELRAAADFVLGN